MSKTDLEEKFKRELDEYVEQECSLQQVEEETRRKKVELESVATEYKFKRHQDALRLNQEIDSFDLDSIKADKRKILEAVSDRGRAVKFLCEGTEDMVLLAPRGLVLMTAPTGNGKSTMTAAIAAPLIKAGKSVLILSNEEDDHDVRVRISCILLGLSFGSYKKNKMSDEQVERIIRHVSEVEELLKVIGNQNELHRKMTMNASGIERLLQSNIGKMDLMILDYYQNVTSHDDLSSDAEAYRAQEKLTVALDTLKHSIGCPIVVMAQCHKLEQKAKKTKESKTNESTFESHHPVYRWQGSKRIINSATDIIEFVKDFESSCTYLFAHKTRFGDQSSKRMLILHFDKTLQTYAGLLKKQPNS